MHWGKRKCETNKHVPVLKIHYFMYTIQILYWSARANCVLEKECVWGAKSHSTANLSVLVRHAARIHWANLPRWSSVVSHDTWTRAHSPSGDSGTASTVQTLIVRPTSQMSPRHQTSNTTESMNDTGLTVIHYMCIFNCVPC